MIEGSLNISIARDFSRVPAGRYQRDGRFTGEAFRTKFLAPALAKKRHVVIDLDGVEGLPSSFWEEVFGGLVRSGVSKADVKNNVSLVTTDAQLSPFVALAWKFLNEAQPVVH